MTSLRHGPPTAGGSRSSAIATAPISFSSCARRAGKSSARQQAKRRRTRLPGTPRSVDLLAPLGHRHVLPARLLRGLGFGRFLPVARHDSRRRLLLTAATATRAAPRLLL